MLQDQKDGSLIPPVLWQWDPNDWPHTWFLITTAYGGYEDGKIEYWNMRLRHKEHQQWAHLL